MFVAWRENDFSAPFKMQHPSAPVALCWTEDICCGASAEQNPVNPIQLVHSVPVALCRFWKCPHGTECKYRHALPLGYVLKSQMKELLEEEVGEHGL